MSTISPVIFAFPPEGWARVAPHMLQWTMVVVRSKMTCSFPQSGHFTLKNLLFGFGMSFSHSLI